MSFTAPLSPSRYTPSVEKPLEDEKQTAAQLSETMRGIQETTYKDVGHPLRSVHAKSHGLLEGELRVLDGLPDVLAQGMFARPATYPAVVRFSTNPGDVLDDSISAPRGVALKVIGVEGERLPGSEGDITQDFIMVNAPAFAAPDTKTFAKNLKLLAATTDTGQSWKKAFSAALRGVEAAAEAVGTKSPMAISMGGQPLTHPLGESYFTQVPFRYGDYVAKLSLAPVSPGLKSLADAPVSVAGRPNALREEIVDFFDDHDGEWELRVQLRTNTDTMPIEDASVPWPEEESPYIPVARLTVRRQPAWNEARAVQVDDGLSFSPWHGLAAHQPLGSINRARKGAYADAAKFRFARNGCPLHEPKSAPHLSQSPARIYGAAPGREGRRPGTPDARPDHWTTPMNDTARHVAAGAAGGLAAGLLLSALLLRTEAQSGRGSELVKLERRTGGYADGRYGDDDADPSLAEEFGVHGGHLALSAAAGAGYGLLKRNGASPVASGLAFGLGFYALAYGLVGPALGVTPKPWRDEPSNLVRHGMMHALFGVVTGLVADQVARRL